MPLRPGSPTITPERRALRAACVFAFVVLFGSAGFMWVEGWDFWKSLFFTLITITTVGYGDYGLSPEGQRFAAILLLGGITVAMYSLGQIMQGVIEHRQTRRHRMYQRIKKLSGHYIICGIGRLGQAVCADLAREDVAFVAVDTDPETIEAAIERGWLAVAGNAAEDEVLEFLGIERATGVACLTSSDAENIVITLSARELNSNLVIISRAENAHSIRKIQRAGATRVISPVLTGGHTIAGAITNPNLTELLDPGHVSAGGIELAEMSIESGSRLDGATPLDYSTDHPLVFVAVKHDKATPELRPPAQEALRAGDVLIVAGDQATIIQARCDAGQDRLAA